LGQWSAAVLACGARAALSHRSAAQLHGLITYYDGPLEVTVGRPDKPTHEGLELRTTTWGPGETTLRKNIPVTSLARTILDLAGVLDTRELTWAFQKARRRGLTFTQIDAVIARHPKKKGRAKLRRIVERERKARGAPRGSFESAFYVWLDGWLPPAHPRPRRNVNVVLSDGIERQADLMFDGVWIELDVHEHHGSTPEGTTADHQRDRAIRRDRYELARFTSDEFKNDRPAIERELRRLLNL
jgi:hypothetical protein